MATKLYARPLSSKMKYKLYFNGNVVGTVSHEDENFPNLFGRYDILPSFEQQGGLVNEFIKYSVEASMLMEEDQNKWQEFMEAEEPKFIELIESDRWILVDESGEIHNILIPNFCSNNEIVWRWNP